MRRCADQLHIREHQLRVCLFAPGLQFELALRIIFYHFRVTAPLVIAREEIQKVKRSSMQVFAFLDAPLVKAECGNV